MALGLTQPQTEMRTRNISWGGGSKGGRCVGLTTLPALCDDCLAICEPQPPGILKSSPGLLWDRCPFTYTIYQVIHQCIPSTINSVTQSAACGRTAAPTTVVQTQLTVLIATGTMSTEITANSR